MVCITGQKCLVLVWLLLWPMSLASANDNNNDNSVDNDPDEPAFGDRCGVYYAPSTIPGAGYGIFAGRDFHESEWVLPGDLVVPLVEMGWNNGHSNDYHHLWEEYQWSSRR